MATFEKKVLAECGDRFIESYDGLVAVNVKSAHRIRRKVWRALRYWRARGQELATPDLFTIACQEARKLAYINDKRVRGETIGWAVAEVDYRLRYGIWPKGGLGDYEFRNY